jgi:3-dehydroquinate synthase
MVEIQVRTSGGDYSALIGRNLYEKELPALLGRISPPAVAVVSHDSVIDLHGERLREALVSSPGQGKGLVYYLFPEGEENKNLKTVEKGYLALLAAGLNREGIIVAFGGGVVGDLAGYLAATYMRGTRLLQVPTTLMAMVDSSIGGKVGVDLPGAKNAVGSFYQPQAVLSDVGVLKTLPQRELRGGLVEIVKYGFLYDDGLLNTVAGWSGDPPDSGGELDGVIARCAGHKAAVVMLDERDLTGERALLNYGHTFGHALESATGYGFLRHGEAVGIGMMMAARLSELCGLAPGGLLERHRDVLKPVLENVVIPKDLEEGRIMRDMMTDKKKGRTLRFVLLEGLQAPRLVDSPGEAVVMQAVAEILQEMRGD